MSQRLCRTVLIAAALLSTPRGELCAQHSDGSLRSTTLGVYTRSQAARGRDLYAMQCRSCHTPESHTGAVFDAWWGGRLVADLFAYVQEKMPKNAPASLTAQEYADVVAYLLRMNAMPTGADELSTDPGELKKIRIERAKEGLPRWWQRENLRPARPTH